MKEEKMVEMQRGGNAFLSVRDSDNTILVCFGLTIEPGCLDEGQVLKLLPYLISTKVEKRVKMYPYWVYSHRTERSIRHEQLLERFCGLTHNVFYCDEPHEHSYYVGVNYERKNWKFGKDDSLALILYRYLQSDSCRENLEPLLFPVVREKNAAKRNKIIRLLTGWLSVASIIGIIAVLIHSPGRVSPQLMLNGVVVLFLFGALAYGALIKKHD